MRTGVKQLILIVDDDVMSRKLLTDVFQAEGYATLTAENGERAIGMARSAKPDLIFLDIQMHVLNGLSAVKALKADRDTRLIPVIAITAKAVGNDREQMLAAGFDEYLSKPFNLNKLRAEVNRRLGGKPEQTAESVAKVDPEPTLAFGHPSAGGDLSAKGRSACGGKSLKE